MSLRMPAWLPSPLTVFLNGEPHARGSPGSFLTVSREWARADRLTFRLPHAYSLQNYVGADQIPGRDGKRYAVLVGPIVLACVGNTSKSEGVKQLPTQSKVGEWLIPRAGDPLHFDVKNQPRLSFVPLFDQAAYKGETFTVYPAFL